MFKVKIIRLKDIIIFMAVIIGLVILGSFLFKNIFSKEKVSFNTKDLVKIGINGESTIIRDVSKETTEEKTEEIEGDNKLSFIFKIGTNIFKSKEKIQDEIKQENIEVSNNSEEVKDTNIDTIKTEVVTPEPIKETYDKEYNSVKIKNETDYELTDDTLNTDDLNIDTNNIIIFHTHTCEAYTTNEEYYYESTRKF